MTNRKRGDRHARSQAEARRRAHAAPQRQHPAREERPEAIEDPGLIEAIDGALEAEHPLDLILLASQLVAALDLTDEGDDAVGSDGERVTLARLMGTFRAAGMRQSDALLLVLAQMLGDDAAADAERAEIRREVAARRHALPGWVLRADRIQPRRAILMTALLDDGLNVVIDVDLPTRRPLTFFVYIDANMGTIVKDAFATDRSLEDVEAFHLEQALERPETGMEVVDVSLADARARIEQGLANWHALQRPVESDSWPAVYGLLRWLLRLMPEGGTVPERVPHSPETLEPYVDDVLASPFAVGLDAGPDALPRAVLRSLLSFSSSLGEGDPLRWSNVTAETALMDWCLRRISAEPKFLAAVPEVLRVLVRYAHAERDAPKGATTEALAGIARFEPEYRAAIADPTRHGLMGMLAEAGLLDSDGVLDAEAVHRLNAKNGFDSGDWSAGGDILDSLAEEVGGHGALARLDAVPLPPEELVLDGVPEDVHERLRSVDAIATRGLRALIEEPECTELVTSARRILARAALADPTLFRRRGRDETWAAAVLWIAAKVNDVLSARRLTSTELHEAVGVKGSSSQRAAALLEALGVDVASTWSQDPILGDPAFLMSARRAEIIDQLEALERLTDGDLWDDDDEDGLSEEDDGDGELDDGELGPDAELTPESAAELAAFLSRFAGPSGAGVPDGSGRARRRRPGAGDQP
ncbi:DUF6398 domain-containing protein [Miniimonas sp. S16]|uniref:DUF6398 domain-containing protein n=1 Tax=Miniimonas sp. S16 TaxID=2171623 RepID=UPI000D52A329|nr:DUF6398 domain-containing protein [Miniimonas sp. S16]